MKKKSLAVDWNWYLVGIAGLLWLINSLIFYPGYLSPDSLNQFSQATGLIPVTDWHPPVMELVWHVLITITGHASSVLLFQTLLLWSALTLIALTLYRLTKSRRVSVIPFGVALLPVILDISGVVWKDVHMAFALLLASTLLLSVAVFKSNQRLKLTAIILSIALITYATLVRYNAFLAVLPIMYLAAIQFSWASSKKRLALAMVGIVAVVGISSILVNTVTRPQPTHPMAAIMLDDMINVVPAEDVQKANISDRLKSVLIASQSECKAGEVIRNAFWACMKKPGQDVISVTHSDELARLWFGSMISHPFSYIGYRAQTFVMFLVVPEGSEYVWHEGITPNELGQSVKFERAQNIMKYYVVDLGHRYFPFLFQGWFWLLVGLLVLRFSKKSDSLGTYTRALSLSSVLYIILYIPIVVAMDYRYIYWSVMATTLAGGLLILDRYFIKKNSLGKTRRFNAAAEKRVDKK
jgi:hypothetical protein